MTIRLAACGLFALGLPMVHAATLTASVAYDPAGLKNPNWTRSGSASYADPDASYAQTDDLPLPSGNRGQDWPYYPVSMGAGANAEGMGATSYSGAGGIASSAASWEDTITNQSGGSRDYQMNLHLSQLSMAVHDWETGANHDFRTGFIANVEINGKSVWRSAQTLRVNNTGVSISKQGVDIGNGDLRNSPDSNYVTYDFWDGYAGKVDLGKLAAGESARVKYTLSSFSYWDDPLGCSAFGCAATNTSTYDPTHVIDRIISTPVPEPESLVMLLAGLGLMGAVARRRPALSVATAGRA